MKIKFLRILRKEIINAGIGEFQVEKDFSPFTNTKLLESKGLHWKMLENSGEKSPCSFLLQFSRHFLLIFFFSFFCRIENLVRGKLDLELKLRLEMELQLEKLDGRVRLIVGWANKKKAQEMEILLKCSYSSSFTFSTSFVLSLCSFLFSTSSSPTFIQDL